MLLIFRRLIFYSDYPLLPLNCQMIRHLLISHRRYPLHSFQMCTYCYVDFLPVFRLFRPFTTCFT